MRPAVHPRSRGEHGSDFLGPIATAGSSPLARGTLHHPLRHDLDHRFIPARAGNTSPKRPRRRSRAVHPRSRGEHVSISASFRSAAGSSPLARGTPERRANPGRGIRFIPARAGNTVASMSTASWRSVHPRSRGEHGSRHRCVTHKIGSSPLARGTRLILHIRPQQTRFIPARAGNTDPEQREAATRPVHPRSRGEHSWARSSAVRVVGSSPLARGTRRRAGVHPRSRRFIPARAGNTGRPRPGSPPPPVHPRSRGEHVLMGRQRRGHLGSSPLARGTRAREPVEARHLRFIPARAGNTAWPASA